MGERGRESLGTSESEQAAEEEVNGVGFEHLEGHRPPGQVGRGKFSARTKAGEGHASHYVIGLFSARFGTEVAWSKNIHTGSVDKVIFLSLAQICLPTATLFR